MRLCLLQFWQSVFGYSISDTKHVHNLASRLSYRPTTAVDGLKISQLWRRVTRKLHAISHPFHWVKFTPFTANCIYRSMTVARVIQATRSEFRRSLVICLLCLMTRLSPSILQDAEQLGCSRIAPWEGEISSGRDGHHNLSRVIVIASSVRNNSVVTHQCCRAITITWIHRQSYRHADPRRQQQHTAVAARVTSNRATRPWRFSYRVTFLTFDLLSSGSMHAERLL